MMPQRKLDGRMVAALLLESLLAFGVVVSLSLVARAFYTQVNQPPIAVGDKSVTHQPVVESPRPPSVATSDELRYNPARTRVYVKSAFAKVMESAKAEAIVIDHIPYGSVVDLGGWDPGRKFVKIKLTPSTTGYVSIKDLTYEDPSAQILRAGEETSGTQTWKKRIHSNLSSNVASTFDQSLDVDASDKGLASQKSLSEFFDILSQNPSKSIFNVGKANVNYIFLSRDLDGNDALIYPRLSQFIYRIKTQPPGPGILFDLGSTGSGQEIFERSLSQPLTLKLTKEPLGLMARPQQELSNVGLSTFKILCMELNCALRFEALPSGGSTALSALVMGQVERVKPTMVMQERESGNVLVGFLDIDGDRQYEAAVYVAKRFADIVNPATVYVAENHEGSWRLKYIKDDAVGVDGPRVSLEPGVHPTPVNVRLYNDGGFGLAYTLDGTEPSCDATKNKSTVVRESEIFIDRNTSIKARTCGGGLKNPPVMTFNYDVKK